MDELRILVTLQVFCRHKIGSIALVEGYVGKTVWCVEVLAALFVEGNE